MAAAGAARTVEEVFRDYKGRRNGLIKALTTDVEDFFRLCNPEKENLCLYGYPNEQWEVNLPVEEVPPELPEPALGINFARDGMQKNDWLTLVAVHSDTWLLSVAFYFGAGFGFQKTDRKRLFDMINELPTILEVVSGNMNTKKQTKVTIYQGSGNKTNSDTQKEEEDGDEHDDTLCGVCGKNYDEFWICCDACERWYHGKCVRITPAQAKNMKQYKCPTCSNKRPRP